MRSSRWGKWVLGGSALVALLVAARAPAWLRTRAGIRVATPTGPPPAGMIYVPAGYCLLGSNDADADDDARPMRRTFVSGFFMDRTEVTNSEYRRFRPEFSFPPGAERQPVTDVTYDEAAAYARWAGKRLPTDQEWEKAARGTDGRRYPWGNTWEQRLVAPRAHRKPAAVPVSAAGGTGCRLGVSRVQNVGSVPGGVSPYGCVDMAGNAWEWVQGYFQGNHQQRVLRGGAVGYGERSCRTYARAIEGAGVT